MNQSATMAQPMVTIIDGAGIESSMLHIEGQSLEEYFASSDMMTAPEAGEIAIMDGVPVDMTDKVPAGASIMIGKVPKNG